MEKIAVIDDFNVFGVFLSGGLDSAILSYLVLKLKSKSNVVFLTGTHKHLDYYNIPYTKKIVAWLDTRFPNRIIDHNITYYKDRIDAQNRKKDINNQLIKKYNIGALLTGLTLNPINNPELMIEGRDIRRDSPVQYQNYYQGIPQYMPFNELDKTGIYKLYKENNILNLGRLTISCESETLHRPCQQCWWCKEKYWAFNYY